MADSTYTAGVYIEHGANRQVVKSGASLDVESGGEIDIESGASFKIAGVAMTATAAELNTVAAGNLVLSRAALAAAGTDATNGGAIATQVVAVTGSDGTKGVVLPAAATTAYPILIINTVLTSGAGLKVYPVNGGNDNINGEAEDAHVLLGPGAEAWFVPTSATQWYVSDKALAGITKAEQDYNDIATLGTGAASKAVVLDASGDYTYPASATIVHPSGATETHSSGSTLNVAGTFQIGGVAVDATAAELNAAADVSARLISIPDATTYAVLVANSGKPHVLPDLTADCTVTLPTPASGLEYTFLYKGIAADAQNWIINTGADVNYFVGGLVHLDTDAGDAADEVVPIAGDGNSNSKCTVVTPNVGTRITALCDGTLWILSGFAVSATVPSFADQ